VRAAKARSVGLAPCDGTAHVLEHAGSVRPERLDDGPEQVHFVARDLEERALVDDRRPHVDGVGRSQRGRDGAEAAQDPVELLAPDRLREVGVHPRLEAPIEVPRHRARRSRRRE
jgi:hypothetical protein